MLSWRCWVSESDALKSNTEIMKSFQWEETAKTKKLSLSQGWNFDSLLPSLSDKHREGLWSFLKNRRKLIFSKRNALGLTLLQESISCHQEDKPSQKSDRKTSPSADLASVLQLWGVAGKPEALNKLPFVYNEALPSIFPHPFSCRSPGDLGPEHHLLFGLMSSKTAPVPHLLVS